jgi:hypothetical protein
LRLCRTGKVGRPSRSTAFRCAGDLAGRLRGRGKTEEGKAEAGKKGAKQPVSVGATSRSRPSRDGPPPPPRSKKKKRSGRRR